MLNYNTVLVTGGTKTPAANGTVDHTYKIGASKYSYRASMEGKVTQAGYLDRKTNVTVTFDEENGPKTQEPSTAANHEASLLLNLNERNKLALGVGESFKVRGYRGAWQIVNTIVDNVMIEPDFHFTVLSGEDVISITQTNGGNAGGNWAFITAKKRAWRLWR